MTTRKRKPRIPQLKHTITRNIGWHCSYRDPDKGTPRKKVFGMVSRGEAEVAYHTWLAEHLGGALPVPEDAIEPLPSSTHATPPARGKPAARRRTATSASAPTSGGGGGECLEGCLLLVANSLLGYERSRVREQGAGRSRGTISASHFREVERHIKDFLRHLNTRHGQGCLTRMSLADLLMSDVESYNKAVVGQGHSVSVVRKRMQAVKMLIDRAGRPELGQQVLDWNWRSRDVYHGKAMQPRKLPTLDQLQGLLDAADSQADFRGQTMIWMGVGLGFGQSDLAAVRIRHIDAESYDMRRGKTGVDRYGVTPPLVWAMVSSYLRSSKGSLSPDALLFTTNQGRPLVHGGTDTVKQWWSRLRKQIGETPGTLDGFYTLRHLGATEFGSRPGTSISDMKRWLGHSASSNMADTYMRPVSPEHREVVAFVRRSLATPVQLSAA